MKAVVVIPGLRETNVFLQPWRYMLEGCRGLRASGFEVTVVTDAAFLGGQIIGLTGAPVVVSSLRRWQNMGALLRAQRADIVVWNVGAVNALHVRLDQLPAPVVAIWSSPLYRLHDLARLGLGPWARRAPHYLVHAAGALLPHGLIRRLLGDNVRVIVTLSAQSAQTLVRMGVTASRVVVVRPGVDPLWIAAGVQSDGTQDPHEVLYFGGSDPVRGPAILLRAGARARAQGVPVHLTMLLRDADAASEREGQRLMRLAIRLGLDSAVRWITGPLSLQDLIAAVRGAGMVALPFTLVISEMPLVVLEAMATARPVISTQLDGISEVLEGDRGYLARPGDVEDMARQLHAAVADPAEAHRRGQRAAALVRGWTWEAMGQHFATAVARAR